MKCMTLQSNRTSVPCKLLPAWIFVFMAAFLLALPQPAYAAKVPPPAVPANLAVPQGNVAYLVGHATGTQNYICLPSAESPTGVAFKLFTPQATLFDDKGGQTSTHFFGPNPDEGGTIRAAWQHAKDTSSVWGMVQQGHSSTDPAYVAQGAIPWLLLTVVGTENGPAGGDKLAKTTFIHRVNTAGGKAPDTGCTSPAEIGNQAYVPYTTDYVFYRAGGK